MPAAVLPQSEECLVKTLQTVRVLTRKDLAAPARHYLLTGAVVKDVAARELGLRPVAFRPQHKNKLGNEFMLYCTQPPLTPALGAWPDPDA